MGHSLSPAVFKPRAAYLVRTMGAKRMAQPANHRGTHPLHDSGRHPTGLFAPGDVLGKSQWRVRFGAAKPLWRSEEAIISAGRRSWVIGHCRLAVHIRPRVTTRVAQLAERQCHPDRSLPAVSLYTLHSTLFILMVGRSCGLSHVIGSTPVAGSICRPSSMEEQPPHRMRG